MGRWRTLRRREAKDDQPRRRVRRRFNRNAKLLTDPMPVTRYRIYSLGSGIDTPLGRRSRLVWYAVLVCLIAVAVVAIAMAR